MQWVTSRPVLWSIILILICNSILLVASNAKAEAQEEEVGTVQLTVASIDTDGNDLIGKYVELRYNGTFVSSGFTPVTFVISNGTEYQVGIADFRRYLFDHWQDTGSTDRWRTITTSDNASLIAVYRIEVETTSTTDTDGGDGDGRASGGGSGGSTRKTVVILDPEEGKIVNPDGFAISGFTIGNPLSVEIAIRNPSTDIATPYVVVTPRAPGDFAWWSHFLAVNDLNMTQIDVRAFFSDESEDSDSVGILYYPKSTGSISGTGDNTDNITRSGTSITGGISSDTSVGILDSMQIDDANVGLAGQDRVSQTPESEIPDDVEKVVTERSSQTLSAFLFTLLLSLAIAVLAWLILRKRQGLMSKVRKR